MSIRALTLAGLAFIALTSSALADSRIIGHVVPHNPLPNGDSGVSGLPPPLHKTPITNLTATKTCAICTFRAPLLTIRK
jgi:hypothetical protein